MRVVSFSGPSNSGKTTLIEKIVKELISSFSITVVKNDPSDKSRLDEEGKDSYRFYQAGADVILTSPKKTAYFFHSRTSIFDIINSCKSDFLFIEGYKHLDIPRVVVFRKFIDESYFKFASVFAVKDVDTSKLDKEVYNLDDVNSIIEWILKLKEYK